MKRLTGWLLPLVLTAMGLTGCGPSEGIVSGTVLVDGQPVSGGVISFVPAEGNGTPATSPVEGGKYEVRTATGKKFVQVSAPQVVGKRKEYEGPDAPLVEITEERLPAKYNSQSELTFDVKAGNNQQDWELKSGK